MDFIAEIVLGWIDLEITNELTDCSDFKILRYRDDYRIYATNDFRAEEILKVVSEKLRTVGMKLGVAKTVISPNVVEGSIKPDKLAALNLQDLGETNAKSIQKKLLRIHAFGRSFPNSGALKRLLSELHYDIVKVDKRPNDLMVQVAITTDIGITSPQAFPVIAGILSHLISLEEQCLKADLWDKVHKKMCCIPFTGYMDIWLQRVKKPLNLPFNSEEKICQIINGETNVILWNNNWITSDDLKLTLDVSKIIVNDPTQMPEVVSPDEVALFNQNTRYGISG